MHSRLVSFKYFFIRFYHCDMYETMKNINIRFYHCAMHETMKNIKY